MPQRINKPELPEMPKDLLSKNKMGAIENIANNIGIDINKLTQPQTNEETQKVKPTINTENEPSRSSILNPIGIFNGFKISYPEYQIITPQTLYSFTVRSMNISDEESFKLSLLNESQLAKHVNKMIWDLIIEKPENIKTYEDFLSKVTTVDRETLLYGIYHITYKDIQNYGITCPYCESKQNVTVNISECFSQLCYDGNQGEFSNKEISSNLYTSGVSVILYQPSLYDEQNILDKMTFVNQNDRGLLSKIINIKKFLIERENGKVEEISNENINNIINGYKTLLPNDRRIIKNLIFENFLKYSMNLTMVSKCQNSKCDKEFEVKIGVLEQFFRAFNE